MPDQYGNPTEEELRGTFVPQVPLPYAYSPETRAAVAARNASGISTRASGDANNYTYEERATPRRDNSPGAQNFQSAFADDPFYSRSDVAPALQGTNRDLLGEGKFGIRGWMNEHPVGMIAAMVAAAAGGAALMPAAGGGAAAGTGAASGTGLGTGAAGGLQSSSGLGIFANGGAGGLAGVGGGNAGALAASGGITGGAGTGFLGSLGGSGALSSSSIQNAGRLNGLLGGDSGSVEMPYMGLGSNYGQPTQQQERPQQGMLGSQTRLLPSMNRPLISYGRKPYQFNGATVWL